VRIYQNIVVGVMVRLAVLLGATFFASGCASIAITLAGVGASMGGQHYLGSIGSKTFSEPLPAVKRATLVALKRMSIQVDTTEKTETGETIKAKIPGREIEIELESLTPNATRMRTLARKESAILLDSATAAEIITQTEKALTAPAPRVSQAAQRG